MDVVKDTINVAGLLTNVYSRSDLRNKSSPEPIVVLFILHGRLDSSDTVDPTARAAFAWAAERQASSKQNPRDFVAVTFVRGVSSFLLFFWGSSGWGPSGNLSGSWHVLMLLV